MVVVPSVYVPLALFVPLKLFTTESTPQLSPTVGAGTTTAAVQTPALATNVMFAGHAIVGSSLSFTMMVCVHVAMLPAMSVTVHVMVVVPTGYTPLALFVPLMEFTTLATEQLSFVTGVGIVTNAWHTPASEFMVWFAGHVIVGLIESSSVTVKLHDVALPLSSVAVIVTTCVVPKPLMVVPAIGLCVSVKLLSQLSSAVTSDV